MKIIVLGAGVVGMTTAYWLWKDGHQVSVVDRQAEPGRETSFGNAGGLCPSFAGPWAAPGMITKVLRLSMQANSPIRFAPTLDPRRISWVMQWMRNCNATRFRVNKLRMQRVAHYSFQCLQDIARQAEIHSFDFHAGGTLQLFRTRDEVAYGQLAVKTLEEYGVPSRFLTKAELRQVEPALAHSHVAVEGALHLPKDASGDSFKFVRELGGFLAARGVAFDYGVTVRALEQQGDRISRVLTSKGELQAHSYVVALGSYAPLLLAPLKLRLPIYPLKGFSITVPVRDDTVVPRVALMDEHNKVMISRLGNRIRAAGMAELTGYGLDIKPERINLLKRVVAELVPQGLDMSATSAWAGLRPMTPDGPPILGKTRWSNLFLNSGHGSNGWTQASGTSKIVADIIGGRTPDIDLEGLTADRFA